MPTAESINAAIATAEANGNTELADTLRTLYGLTTDAAATEQTKDNRPIMERIKTFGDALAELGEVHPLVKQWTWLTGCEVDDEEYTDGEVIRGGEFSDIRAYLQLRIITAALNEGWKPEFTENEWRYWPYFKLYTDEEIAETGEEQRSRVVYRGGVIAYAYDGVAGAYSDASGSYAVVGSRLAFKTRELAAYAGQQFTEIYADFMFRHK